MTRHFVNTLAAIFILFSAVTVLFPCLSEAGGVILYEVGSQDVGLASAGWSARAEDPSTAFTNPAGMIRLSSPEAEFGAQPIYSHLTFDPDSSTTVDGSDGNGSLWIPSGGAFYVQPVNECVSLGASVVGYFGSKMDFNHSWVGRYYLTEATLQGFSFVPAAAARIREDLSIGIGANIMYGIFRQTSAINNALDSLPDGRLKLKDGDFGYGCIVGVLYEPTPCTRIGLQYLSEVKLNFHIKPHFHGVGPTLTSFITASGIKNTRVNLDVRVPKSLMFSIYHDLCPSLAVMGNLGWQEWSNFQKASITLGSATALSLTTTPKYKNTWHAAIGVKYRYSECLALTAGYAYDSSAVSSANRTLDFPVGRQRRYGLGAEWQLREALSLGLQYEYQYQGKLTVDANKGSLAGHVSGEYDSYIHFINLNAQWVF